MNCKEEIKKILDYLNGFELIEISSKKAMKIGFNHSEINNINFGQSREDRASDINSDINIARVLTIQFLDNKTLEIVPYYHTTTFKGSKTYIKDYTVVKYYKINNGSIDFNYIEKIINGSASLNIHFKYNTELIIHPMRDDFKIPSIISIDIIVNDKCVYTDRLEYIPDPNMKLLGKYVVKFSDDYFKKGIKDATIIIKFNNKNSTVFLS